MGHIFLQMRNLVLGFLFFLPLAQVCAQTFASTVLDAETQMPIPYANIVYGEAQGVITNDEGRFRFTMKRNAQALDSVYISCMGYQKKGFTKNQLNDSVVYLQPGGFGLIGVDLLGKGLTADEIVQKMVDSIPVNYNTMPVQKKFFLRQSTYDQIDRLNLVLNQSTLPHVNPLSLDSVVNALPKSSEYHTETLGTLYKADNAIKIEVDKATELYDKKKQATYNALDLKLKTLLRRHVLPDSYFKVKTGPIAAKLDLDTIIGRPVPEPQVDGGVATSIKFNYLITREKRLQKIENQLFDNKSRLEVIEKRAAYLFFKDKTVEIDGNRYYIIHFEPKRRAPLKGSMVINATDFALVRMDYENVKPLKAFKLLGVVYNEPVYKGWLEYSKMKNGKYELRSSKLQHDFYVNAERPFKVVEKNKNAKGRRKQNEIDLELYLTAKVQNTFEWVALESKGSSQSTFDKVPRRKIIEVMYKTQYDTEYWKGSNVVLPTAKLQGFTLVDN